MPNSQCTKIAIFESGRQLTNFVKLYKTTKEDANLETLRAIVIEEAPSALSAVLKSYGNNKYEYSVNKRFAKTKLANMNTKIIPGNELAIGSGSVIQSASQGLSSDDRNIASVDKGEAIIRFTILPIPIKIPLFEDIVRENFQEPHIVK
ncbi:MAG: hypothetical protein WA667_21545 [Candidatus Nitrosopolaris sp.]